MFAVILAAGKGQRINSDVSNLPKSLLQMKNGKSILYNDLLNIHGCSKIRKVNVVTGFQNLKINKEIEMFKNEHPNRGIEITPIFNPIYEKGVLTSLHKGIENINDHCVIINADTYYSSDVWQAINTIEDSTLLASSSKSSNDSVKVSTDQNKIIQVGKEIKEYSHISSGCLYLNRLHIKLADTFLVESINNNRKMIWHELVNYLIEKNEIIVIKEILQNSYFEIDTWEDYYQFNLYQGDSFY